MDRGSRTVVVGDVHGCIHELRDLLAKCEFRKGTDRLVFVGDLVGKGPDSAAVVQLALDHGAETVRGNHDHNVLTYAWGQPQFPNEDHEQVSRTLSEEQVAYLASTPFHLDLPDHNVLVVHGGLLPGSDPSDMKPNDLMNMRNVLDDGSPYRFIDKGTPWAELWQGPRHVVFGHDALRMLQRYPHATGLDTGCCYGYELTALVLPRHRLVTVPARRAWAPV